VEATASFFNKIVDLNPESCGCDSKPPSLDSRLSLLGAVSNTEGSLPPRPNIVLIISDDVDREVTSSVFIIFYFLKRIFIELLSQCRYYITTFLFNYLMNFQCWQKIKNHNQVE
jgi:hypothetical protein